MSLLPETVYPVHEPAASQVIAFEELRDIILHQAGNYHIIDARIPGRFSGTQEEADPSLRSGHMPSAINIPLAAMLDADSKAFLLLSELKELFEKAGIGATFSPLLPPFTVSKESTGSRGILQPPRIRPLTSVAVRDNLTLSTWLLLGGLLQGLAVMVFGTYALIPTMLILLYRTTDHLLMAANITRNRYMDGVIQTKFSAQAPNTDGTFGKELASESIVVFHLGARSNHPLGLLAPGFPEINRQVIAMNREMNSNPVKYGLLGSSAWIKQDDSAGNDVMSIYYLRDYDALHRFAHGSLHVEGMRWWTEIVKDHPHIAIYHETYIVPKGKWENIYINSKPTGLGDAWFPVAEEGKGEDSVSRFVRPIVDARHPALRSASRRLAMRQLEGREEAEDELYDRTW
ncbi:hypothetical protein APSETT444_009074 [Aspergillus pseudonomiae]